MESEADFKPEIRNTEGGLAFLAAVPWLAGAIGRKVAFTGAKKGAKFAVKRAAKKKTLKRGTQRGFRGAQRGMQRDMRRRPGSPRGRPPRKKKKWYQFKRDKLEDAADWSQDETDWDEGDETDWSEGDETDWSEDDETDWSEGDETDWNEGDETDWGQDETQWGGDNLFLEKNVHDNKYIIDYNKMLKTSIPTSADNTLDTIGGAELNAPNSNVSVKQENLTEVSSYEAGKIKEGIAKLTDDVQFKLDVKRNEVEKNIGKYGVKMSDDMGPTMMTAELTLKTIGGLTEANKWIIALMIASTLVLLYVLYTLCKPSLSGHWLSESSELGRTTISHNRFTNNCDIYVIKNSKNSDTVHRQGYLRKNIIYINITTEYIQFGVWDYKDNIRIFPENTSNDGRYINLVATELTRVR